MPQLAPVLLIGREFMADSHGDGAAERAGRYPALADALTVNYWRSST
jgi:hypothetical protein